MTICYAHFWITNQIPYWWGKYKYRYYPSCNCTRISTLGTRTPIIVYGLKTVKKVDTIFKYPHFVCTHMGWVHAEMNWLIKRQRLHWMKDPQSLNERPTIMILLVPYTCLHVAGAVVQGHVSSLFRLIIPGVCLAQFSLNNVHKRGLKHHHFISHVCMFSSTQFSQEWARRKVVVKHSIKSNPTGSAVQCDLPHTSYLTM